MQCIIMEKHSNQITTAYYRHKHDSYYFYLSGYFADFEGDLHFATNILYPFQKRTNSLQVVDGKLRGINCTFFVKLIDMSRGLIMTSK